jgi:Tfp pilus assembly protein PilO
MNINIPKTPINLSTGPIKRPQNFSNTSFEIVLLIIVGVLLYFFIVSPKQQELQAKKDSVTQLTDQKNKLERENKAVQKALDDMKKSKTGIAKLDEALPLDGRPSKIYLLLDDIMIQSGMTVKSMDFPDATGDIVAGNSTRVEKPFTGQRKLHEVTINLTVTGSFDQYLGVLKRLETSGRLFNIQNVEITSTGDTDVEFVMTLITYFYE